MANQLERWVGNKSLSPLRQFLQMRDPFESFFTDFANMNSRVAPLDMDFYPTSEVTEEGNHYLLKVDLPGIAKDHVKIEADKDRLMIRAERREEKKTDTKKKYLSEVYYVSYERTFTLPGPIDEKKIDARFENGVLTITVPKTEALQAKQIQIQ